MSGLKLFPMNTKDPIINFITQEHIEFCFQKAVELIPSLPTEIIKTWELEIRGGPCLKCKIPYKRVVKSGTCGLFTYFQPNCHCFKQCIRAGVEADWIQENGSKRKSIRYRKGCGKLLIEEWLLKLDRCTNCNGIIV